MDYLYDGSFDGLLTCIYHHYYGAAASSIYQQDYYQPGLMVNTKVVETDPALAKRVYIAIEEKISGDALEKTYHVYLSSDSNKENLILNYLRLGFKMGAKVDHYHSHPDVYSLHKLNRRVGIETHRLLGLLRFKDTGRFLYAAMSPDHHILTLIADHFADRLAGERWIIHDQKRKLAIVYVGQDDSKMKPIQDKWYLTDFAYLMEDDIADKDQHWQQLWQLYFQKIGIESRLNPRLQSQFVPQRYRRHLLEFQYTSGTRKVP
ncbi:MAG: DNA metabolism protein [Syntrophomonadaceae bacterium]|jgi:probable DNA metabolism protein|nr:DNA metabolism protein [Syntrophomonadaceae bacterium]